MPIKKTFRTPVWKWKGFHITLMMHSHARLLTSGRLTQSNNNKANQNAL